MDVSFGRKKENIVADAIPAKSYVHRMLIVAAMSGEGALIKCAVKSEDICATVSVLTDLGAKITDNSEGFEVISGVKSGDSVVLDCKESGSTARFLLPLASYLYKEVILTGEGRLLQRPFEPLLEAMAENGITYEKNEKNIRVYGGLCPGVYHIVGDVSSQFVSGLLFALSYMDDESKIVLTSNLQSKGYVDETLEVLENGGFTAFFENNTYTVSKRKSRFNFPKSLFPEGDWTSAVYILAHGALKGSACVTGLNVKSIQGDRIALELFDRIGAKVCVDGNEVHASHNELRGIEFDAKDVPDIVPAMAVVLAFADSKSVIHGVERLRGKESDRVEETIKLIELAGADVTVCKEQDREDLIIIPNREFKQNNEIELTIDAAGDHRIAMAASLISSGLGATIKIRGAEAVRKSYPDYFANF